RYYRDVAAALGEHAQDVVLHAVVVGHDPVLRLGPGKFAAVEVEPAVAPRIGAARADFLRQVHAVQAGELARGLDGLVDVDRPGHHGAVLGAAIAQQAGQLAGVDVGDGDDAAGAQPFGQRTFAAPAARAPRHVAHHQARGPGLRGCGVQRGAGAGAGVRIGQRGDLPGWG